MEAAEDMELVAALGRGDSLEALAESGAQVAVELTTPASVMDNLDYCVRRRHPTPSSAPPAGPTSVSPS
ncbi:hypothetical protein STENM327S_02529 [Streptomyces tendae]